MNLNNYVLKRSQWVPQQVEDVFAFFSDAANLELLTPPWLRFKIITPGPIEMRTNTLIDYRLNLHGIPLCWQTKIVCWKPPYRFEDLQVKGPYRLWHHTHTFEAVDGGTLLSDCAEYALPLGLLGRLIHAMSVGRSVRSIFDFRNAKIREIFGSDTRSNLEGS
jgi:ligand-binding SRPBCC domain-containing protein